MKRIYVTTIPLQGFRDLAKNTYRSAANSGDIETRFPILQVLHNTLQEGDDFHIIAIRSVNGDTQRNFGYLKEELQAMGFTEDHIRELSMPDEQDCSTLIRLCRDLCDVLPEKGIAYMDITYGTKTIPLVQLAALTCAAATHEELEVGGVYYGASTARAWISPFSTMLRRFITCRASWAASTATRIPPRWSTTSWCG